MEVSPVELLTKYRNKGLLIDSNLLLTWFLGLFDPSWILRHERTSSYTLEDFEDLNAFASQFSRIVVTPNILTEVSNLAQRTTRSKLPSEFFVSFASAVHRLRESFYKSSLVVQDRCFHYLGFTDASIAQLPPGRYLVLTDDLELYGELLDRNIDAINFNHLRRIG